MSGWLRRGQSAVPNIPLLSTPLKVSFLHFVMFFYIDFICSYLEYLIYLKYWRFTPSPQWTLATIHLPLHMALPLHQVDTLPLHQVDTLYLLRQSVVIHPLLLPCIVAILPLHQVDTLHPQIHRIVGILHPQLKLIVGIHHYIMAIVMSLLLSPSSQFLLISLSSIT